MEDYYFDELMAVFEEYDILHRSRDDDEIEDEYVSPMEFLGMGGETFGP